MENNIIYQKSVQFSIQLIESLKNLDSPEFKHQVHQLRRSGTAIGASIAEADSAESLIDFIHKMKIADKEANETMYWLKILENIIPEAINPLNESITEIKRILRSILVTSTNRLKTKQKSEKSK
ncbi:MAG TPA: four helix bundle protein [Chitinophagaceae bacterium]|nr:four helix bundle protein [Chitinophagaceae bacterium]